MSRKELSFLWENRFLIGKPNLLAGHGGGTKSYFTCFMASVISRGWNWPDGTPCPKGSTIIINCEDGAEDTILPRVEDCGGDLKKVFYVDAVRKVEPDGTVASEGFTVQHVDELRDMIDELGDVRMVVLDPVTAFLDGIDDNKNGQLRAALRPLGELAEEKGFCLIYVTHLRKGASDNTVAADRVLGSVAYSNAARVTWFITNDPDDNELRIMSPGKGNNLRNPKGLSYKIIDNMVQLIDWDLDITADEALRMQAGFQRRDGRSDKPAAQKDAAHEWLLEALAGGQRFVGNPKNPEEGTLRYDAKQAGLSWSTVLRSSKDIGVVIEKEHFSKKYCWKLPVESGPEEQDIQEVTEWQP